MSILLTGGSGFVGSYFLNNSTLDLKSISLKSNRVENIDFKGAVIPHHILAGDIIADITKNFKNKGSLTKGIPL
jgi:hypothetical protein